MPFDTSLEFITNAALKGDVIAIAKYLEKGGKPDIVFKDELNHKETTILERAIHGYEMRKDFIFGESEIKPLYDSHEPRGAMGFHRIDDNDNLPGTYPLKTAEEGQKILINIAKLQLAYGYEPSKFSVILAHERVRQRELESDAKTQKWSAPESKNMLFKYLEDVCAGKMPIPSKESLYEDGILPESEKPKAKRAPHKGILLDTLTPEGQLKSRVGLDQDITKRR